MIFRQFYFDMFGDPILESQPLSKFITDMKQVAEIRPQGFDIIDCLNLSVKEAGLIRLTSPGSFGHS